MHLAQQHIANVTLSSRYLRARKFVPQDAFAQFKDTEIWRKDNDLDALYEKIDIRDYQEARSVVGESFPKQASFKLTIPKYPQWTGRRDKRGIPVYLYEVSKLDSKKMVAYTSSTSKAKTKGPSPTRMLRLFALYENLTRFVMPLCSAVPGRPNPETPVDQSNNIVDISKVGLKQFWNLRSHMQDASTLATAHYPETLDRIFVSIHQTFDTLHRALTKAALRSLVHHHSSLPSGVGSRNGSIQSPHPKFSFCQATKSYLRSLLSSILKTFLRNMAAS